MLPRTLLVTAALACTTDTSDTDTDTDPVHLTATGTQVEVCDAAPSAAVDVRAARLEGDDLLIDVFHGGGCAAHFFALCWDGSWNDVEPAEVSLALLHDANGDGCEAGFFETLRFSLLPVRNGDGEVVVWLSGLQPPTPLSYTW